MVLLFGPPMHTWTRSVWSRNKLDRITAKRQVARVPFRRWHGNGESGNTAVTTVITAGMGKISR